MENYKERLEALNREIERASNTDAIVAELGIIKSELLSELLATSNEMIANLKNIKNIL